MTLPAESSCPDLAQLRPIIAAGSQGPVGVFRPQPTLQNQAQTESLNLSDPVDGAQVYFRVSGFAMVLRQTLTQTFRLKLTQQYMHPLEMLVRHAVPRRYQKHGLDFTYYGISRRHAGYLMALGSMGLAFTWEDREDGIYKSYPIVVEDFFPNEDRAIQQMLIDAVAVHEYGELVLDGHHEASLLEFAIVQKEGNLERYLEFLERRYRTKFRDVVYERILPFVNEALRERGIDIDDDAESIEVGDAVEADSSREDPSRMLARQLADSFVWPEGISEHYKIALEEDEGDLRVLAEWTAETLRAVSYVERTIDDGLVRAKDAFVWSLENGADLDQAIGAAKALFVWPFVEHQHEFDSAMVDELKGNGRELMEAAFGEALDELNDMVQDRLKPDEADRSELGPFNDLTLNAILEMAKLEHELFDTITHKLGYDYHEEWLDGRDTPPFEREIEEDQDYCLHRLIWQACARIPDMTDLERVLQIAEAPVLCISQMPEKYIETWIWRHIDSTSAKIGLTHYEWYYASVTRMSIEELIGIVIARRDRCVADYIEEYRKNDPRGLELFGERVTDIARDQPILELQFDQVITTLKSYRAQDLTLVWNADAIEDVVAQVEADPVMDEHAIAQFAEQAKLFGAAIVPKENPYEGRVKNMLANAGRLGVIDRHFRRWDDCYKPLFSRALLMVVNKLVEVGIVLDDRGIHEIALGLGKSYNAHYSYYASDGVDYPKDLSPVVEAIRAEDASSDRFEYQAWMSVINKMNWDLPSWLDHGNVVNFWVDREQEKERFESAGLMSAVDKSKLDEVREKTIAIALNHTKLREKLFSIVDAYAREGSAQDQNLLEMIYYLFTDSELLSLVGRQREFDMFQTIFIRFEDSCRRHPDGHNEYLYGRFGDQFRALPEHYIREWWKTARSKKRKREGRSVPFREKAAHEFMAGVLANVIVSNPDHAVPIWNMRMHAKLAPGMSQRERWLLPAAVLEHARINYPHVSSRRRSFYELVLRNCRAREE